jgi:hypothetical protein
LNGCKTPEGIIYMHLNALRCVILDVKLNIIPF